MDRTNYPLLSIVAIVAIVAMVAIFLQAKAPAGLPSISAVATQAAAVFDVPLTGHITQDTAAPAMQPAGNPLDLNSDGVIDSKDSDVLGLVIDRVTFCPKSKRCDINQDGIVDLQDLSALNALIVKQGTGKAGGPSTPVATSTASDVSDQVGSFGAVS